MIYKDNKEMMNLKKKILKNTKNKYNSKMNRNRTKKMKNWSI